MSRRTILLIAATVLVLLAIPVIYLACTWSTHNPLRFEVTRLDVEGEVSHMLGTMDITMRNTSTLPVHLSQIKFEGEAKKPGSVMGGFGGVLYLKLEDGSKTPFVGSLYLPPKGSISCELMFVGQVDGGNDRKFLDTVEADYHWRSGTVEKIDKLYDRYIYRRPEGLDRFIPRPKEFHHRAPLELPATSP